jgi:hypothetical protein
MFSALRWDAIVKAMLAHSCAVGHRRIAVALVTDKASAAIGICIAIALANF